jgi:hypothetical protein
MKMGVRSGLAQLRGTLALDPDALHKATADHQDCQVENSLSPSVR